MYKNYREESFWTFTVSFVERFIVLCPYLGEFTIRGSTVLLH